MVGKNGNINILSARLRSLRIVVRKLDLVLWTEFANFASRHDRSSESCQSGRMGTPGKRVYSYGYRGFESLTLRYLIDL